MQPLKHIETAVSNYMQLSTNVLFMPTPMYYMESQYYPPANISAYKQDRWIYGAQDMH